MKRLLVACLVVAAVVMPTAASAQGAQGLTIKDVDVTGYPTVSVTVSTDEQISADDIQVADNGQPIEDVSVEDLSAAGQKVSVVLLVDTSGSMQGEPMVAAKQAAQDFIRTLPDEEIEIGIVTFADDARTVVPASSNHDRALKAISGLEATGETALYDGVIEAINSFEGEGQRNIVLLSDGGDTASEATLQGAVAAAKEVDTSIYAVGLQSGEFDVRALRTLSEETNGRYAPAATANLSAVYEGLASELSQQFVITYESVTEPGSQLEIAVDSSIGEDSVFVLTPDVEVSPAPVDVPKPREPAGDPLLAGTVGKAVVLVMTFLTVLLLMLMILGASQRRQRDRDLARRIQAKPRSDRTVEEEKGLISWIPDAVMNMAEGIADNKGWADKLETKMDSAGWPWRPAELIAVMGVLALIGLMVGASLAGVIVGLFFAVLFGLLPLGVLNLSRSRRLKKIQDQLPDVLMILASSLRAGHSFLQALDSVAKEIGAPTNREFQRVVAEIRLGRKIEEALNDLAQRVESEDFEWAILAVNIQREVGGNLAEILDTVAETIRERATVRRQVDVLASEGKLSVVILSVLPFAVATWMAIVNPEYIGLLFTTRIGILMVMGASALLVAGIYWMRKVVKIDV